MRHLLSRPAGVLLFSTMIMLERGCYYGIRAVLVLYLTAADGLALDTETTLSVISPASAAIGILFFPLGLLTDLTFKQEKGVIIGSLLALGGSLALFANDIAVIVVALIAIVAGGGLMRLNSYVLLGRLFERSNRNRNIAILFTYLLINLGAFAGIVGLGYIGETISWLYSLALGALLTLTYLLLFLLFRKQINYQENTLQPSYTTSSSHTPILDQALDLPPQWQRQQRSILPIILLLVASTVLFWTSHPMASLPTTDLLRSLGDISVMGITISPAFFDGFSSLMGTLLIGLLILLIYWSVTKVGSSLRLLGFALIGTGIAMILTQYVDQLPTDLLIPGGFLILSLLAIGESLLAPVSVAYLTRISSRKYASTTLGAYFTLITLIPQGLQQLGIDPTIEVIIVTIVTILLGISLYAFRQRILQHTNGID